MIILRFRPPECKISYRRVDRWGSSILSLSRPTPAHWRGPSLCYGCGCAEPMRIPPPPPHTAQGCRGRQIQRGKMACPGSHSQSGAELGAQVCGKRLHEQQGLRGAGCMEAAPGLGVGYNLLGAGDMPARARAVCVNKQCLL